MLSHLPRQESRYRILPEWQERSNWRGLALAVESFVADVRLLLEGLEKVREELRALSFDEPKWEEIWDECHRIYVALDTLTVEVARILLHPDANDVGWVLVRDGSGEEEEEGESTSKVTLYRAPINVAALLHERLFAAKRTVILTSATLGAEGGFGFLRERLGLHRADELSLGSPYDFGRQALVYVASDLPEPNQPHYSTQMHHALVELARATEGRMLVLFTSKSQLNQAYRAISDPLAHDDIVVLAQYMDGSRTHLIERFRTIERAVLLGTHSFWEGIDIPGPALSCLVITRLPFPVPTDPVQAARSLMYQNPFLEYSVPQTVIRFRQGFGRLLRTTQDRGIVRSAGFAPGIEALWGSLPELPPARRPARRSLPRPAAPCRPLARQRHRPSCRRGLWLSIAPPSTPKPCLIRLLGLHCLLFARGSEREPSPWIHLAFPCDSF